MDDSPATANSSALSHRDFRRYLGAAFLAILATQIQSVAVGWQVYSIARTPLALGYVGLFQFLPMMACTIPAGHMADRFDRRLILVISNFCSAIAAGCFLTLALTRTTVIWPFYAVLVIFGASRAFAGPASQSLVPLLVPQDQFPQAVAWASSTSQVAVIAGPAIGGAIYILGPAVDYGVCLILFATVAIVMMGIRSRGMRYEAEADTTAFERITAGIAYVWRKPLILGAFSLDLFAVLLGGATALLPVYARDILHVGPLGLGVLRSAPALGAAMLGLALGQQALQRRAGLAMFACVAIFGVATIVFGLSENFALSIGRAVRDRRVGHGERLRAHDAHATCDARCDARAGERGEQAVRRRVERAGRVRIGRHRDMVRHGACGGDRRRRHAGHRRCLVSAVSEPARSGSAVRSDAVNQLMHSISRFNAAAENVRMLATRSELPVSQVVERSTGPATAMQLWPAASP